MRIFFSGFFIMSILYSTAQVFNSDISARAYVMGNTVVANIDHWALFHNIGGLSHVRRITFLHSIYRRFNINALTTFHVGFIYPKIPGTLGISIQSFGDRHFNQQQYGLGYGHKIGKTSLGIKINYQRTNALFVSPRHQVFIEFGAITKLTPELTIGFNLLNIKLINSPEGPQPTFSLTLKTGFSYQSNDRFGINFEIEKNQNSIVNLKLGLRYLILKKVHLATGVQINPLKNHFGLGYSFGKLQLDLGISHHYPLGFSQILSLSWQVDD